MMNYIILASKSVYALQKTAFVKSGRHGEDIFLHQNTQILYANRKRSCYVYLDKHSVVSLHLGSKTMLLCMGQHPSTPYVVGIRNVINIGVVLLYVFGFWIFVSAKLSGQHFHHHVEWPEYFRGSSLGHCTSTLPIKYLHNDHDHGDRQ